MRAVCEFGRRRRLDPGRGQPAEVVLPAQHGPLVAVLLCPGGGDGAQSGQRGAHLGAQVVDLRPHRVEHIGGPAAGGLDGGPGRGEALGRLLEDGTPALGTDELSPARARCEMDQTHWLTGASTLRSCNARDRDRKIDRRACQRPPCHGFGGFAAHRPVAADSARRNTEHGLFRLVAVGHETTFEDIGGTRNIGQCSRDRTACAGFRRGYGEPPRPAEIKERARLPEQLGKLSARADADIEHAGCLAVTDRLEDRADRELVGVSQHRR